MKQLITIIISFIFGVVFTFFIAREACVSVISSDFIAMYQTLQFVKTSGNNKAIVDLVAAMQTNLVMGNMYGGAFFTGLSDAYSIVLDFDNIREEYRELLPNSFYTGEFEKRYQETLMKLKINERSGDIIHNY